MTLQRPQKHGEIEHSVASMQSAGRCWQLSHVVSSWGRTTISSIQVFNQWLISLYTASSVKNKSHRGFSEKCVCKRVSKNSYSVVHRVLVGLSLEKSRELPFIKFVWTNLRCITLHRSRWEVLSLLGRRQLLEQEVPGSLCLWPGHPSSPTTTSHTLCPADSAVQRSSNALV